MTILINLSNLHVGGGVAVASSFVDSLSKFRLRDCPRCFLLLSTECYANLSSLNTDLSRFKGFLVYDSRPRNILTTSRIFRDLRPKVVFSVFGPTYAFIDSQVKLVTGIANPYIIYPDNAYTKSLSYFQRALVRLSVLAPLLFLHRVDHYLCETQAASESIKRRFPGSAITVVPSGYHDLFLTQSSWRKVDHTRLRSDSLKLGLISHNYPHKNLKILQSVLAILRNRYRLRVDFFVTLSETERKKVCAEDGEQLCSVGPLMLSQCPSFYSQMDGIVFPSLLESFSAVTLETLLMRRPLFVSNVPCVSEPCQGYCIAFDPSSAEDIAEKIVSYFQVPFELRISQIDKAYEYALSKSDSAQRRADAYIDILNRYCHE